MASYKIKNKDMDFPPEQGVAGILLEKELVNKNDWSKIEISYYKDDRLGWASCAYNKIYANLLKVEVEEEYQNQGIGKNLVEKVFEEMKQKNVKHIYTVVANKEGKRLIESKSFSHKSPISELSRDNSIFYKKL